MKNASLNEAYDRVDKSAGGNLFFIPGYTVQGKTVM